MKIINDQVVIPINNKKPKPESILGYQLFGEPYANIFICAKKKSGKTNVVNKILQVCAGKNTHVLIFASTVYKDEQYTHIKNTLEKKSIKVDFYVDISTLSEILSSLSVSEDVDTTIKDEFFRKTTTKSRKIQPLYIFVFDDLSKQLQKESISALAKSNRHYKAKVIISSQDIMDLSRPARSQMDYILLFGGHSDERLEAIFKNANLDISLEDFIIMYRVVTKEKYDFLYIDTIEQLFRKNFNLQIN